MKKFTKEIKRIHSNLPKLTNNFIDCFNTTGYANDTPANTFYKQLSDGSYVFVAKDSKTESFAYVDIKPLETGWYKFVVKCYKFKNGYSSCHYGLVIFHS